jgi:hypothetical protein
MVEGFTATFPGDNAIDRAPGSTLRTSGVFANSMKGAVTVKQVHLVSVHVQFHPSSV